MSEEAENNDKCPLCGHKDKKLAKLNQQIAEKIKERQSYTGPGFARSIVDREIQVLKDAFAARRSKGK